MQFMKIHIYLYFYTIGAPLGRTGELI